MTAGCRFTRTLGTLVSSGVPILQSLSIVKETSGNAVIAKAVEGIHESVKEGESITTPLAAAKGGVFPPMVTQMIGVGEKTGGLSEMLNKIADFYDEEVDDFLYLPRYHGAGAGHGKQHEFAQREMFPLAHFGSPCLRAVITGSAGT